MDLTTIVGLIFQVGEAIIKYGPEFVQDAEQVWANLKLAYASASSGTPLTADQQKQYDDALTAAQTALDAAAAAQQAQV